MTIPLKCPGVGRDKDHDRALQFYFNRPVTDDEMRCLHDILQDVVAGMDRAGALADWRERVRRWLG